MKLFAHRQAFQAVVKPLSCLLFAVAALVPARAADLLAAEEVAGRLAAADGAPGSVRVLGFLAHDCQHYRRLVSRTPSSSRNETSPEITPRDFTSVGLLFEGTPPDSRL